MAFSKLFWSILAGVSLGAAACGGATEYGPPADTGAEDQAQGEPSDAKEGDALAEEVPADTGGEEPLSGAYGPPSL